MKKVKKLKDGDIYQYYSLILYKYDGLQKKIQTQLYEIGIYVIDESGGQFNFTIENYLKMQDNLKFYESTKEVEELEFLLPVNLIIKNGLYEKI